MNDPDMTHLFDMTKGHCERHGLTAFECVRCAQERAAADDDGLALVAEVQRLRTENAALERREAAVIKILKDIRELTTLDDQESQSELYYLCDYARAMADEALRAFSLNGGAK